MKDYTPEFYAFITQTALRSARIIVPQLSQLVQPSSVLDVGCGTGAWLAVFREHGVDDVRGIEREWFTSDKLLFPRELFQRLDLSQPFSLERSFDLVICLEVAEHLPARAAEGLVRSLVRCGPVVLFSAAIPFQGGTNHLNENWPDYWARLFLQQEFVPIDVLRKHLWGNNDVAPWYAQNTVLYVRRTALQQYPPLVQEAPVDDLQQLNLVHPKYYLAVADPSRQSLLDVLRLSLATLKRAIQRRLRGGA